MGSQTPTRSGRGRKRKEGEKREKVTKSCVDLATGWEVGT